MTEILKGSLVAKKIKESMAERIKELESKGKTSTIGVVRLGSDPSDISYEKSIIKSCEKLGIKSIVYEKDENISTDDLMQFMDVLNKNDYISGILLFRPLPKHIDEERIRTSISPDKDVDCMHPLNLELIFEGDMEGFAPATPKAAMEILIHNNIELEGKNVVIINRSMVVGKPLAMMLLQKNATVTICHSRTKNLEELTRNADIVVTALGKAKYFDKKYFTEKSIVIDVGVSLDREGNLSGDVDFDSVSDFVEAITPVPGGVGSVTTTVLLNQVVKACFRQLTEDR
ncbi:bifunctional 5,10-methylenetetrahydrofolate dehydrogenase/5,10-methenyltetrahydrofolate cyclohydrolase [Paratissierella segnis]|uniref:Bifunctional protein FolD n=1 Tax=Paratissierella segnis TaxID=2763679 RepID=A0A926IKJ6_9FIRM|nr:bifunctional 5,10-methylenetetrahydrofolate dehydrogenase/5,10-methenyltetrahydrofolate cyclohydrolase [Paratissierella segnis]MBC8588360.1 bifunctional 5,10-methylenetetrahydrofolate dehydrogenase/5,10-methenyltetrahydrofolate cyclohydrolase [Paratissierella segnis]